VAIRRAAVAIGSVTVVALLAVLDEAVAAYHRGCSSGLEGCAAKERLPSINPTSGQRSIGGDQHGDDNR
jgi:hypothetical protein